MAEVPLVRVEGKSFASGATLTPERFLRNPVLLRASKTQATRNAEAGLGLGDCLYFYVGYACPAFGELVFVFDPEWSDTHSGTATPFDTGGLFARYIKALGIDDAATALDYFTRHRTTLTVWRQRFAEYLRDYFESPSAYVRGERAHHDDTSGRLLHPENERRAWTWEIQLHDDHEALRDLQLFCVSSDWSDALRNATLTMPATEAAPWRAFMKSARYRVAPANTEAAMICRMAEEEIASWL